MLKILLSGALGMDAEVKNLGSSKVINFSVAVNQDYKDSTGKKVEKTEWVSAHIWKSEAQSTQIAEYLKKGKKVLIEGEPSVDAYLSKENAPKGSLSVKVYNIELLN